FNGTADQGRSNEPILAMPTKDEMTRQRKIAEETALVHLGVLAFNPLVRAGQARAARVRLAELKKQEESIKPATTLVMKELDKPRPTHIHIRGNHTKKGDAVTPGVPAKLHPVRRGEPGGSPDRGGSPNRLDFARWLVDPDNPLVGRVTMNRIWAR